MPSSAASSSDSDSDSSSRIDDARPAAAPSAAKNAKGKAKAKPQPAHKSKDTISSSDEDDSSSEDDDDHHAHGHPPVVVARELRYRAPSDMAPLKIEHASSTFDYDRLLANPKLELWAIRVPDGLKAKHLSTLSLSLSGSGEPSGFLSTKSTDYTLKSSSSTESGEELSALMPFVPRKAKGAFFPAPRKITSHLILSPVPLPTATPATRYVPPAKPPRVQPTDKLRFRNNPLGTSRPSAKVAAGEKEEEEDVPMEIADPAAPAEKKGKKRKVEGEGKEEDGEKKKKKKKVREEE